MKRIAVCFLNCFTNIVIIIEITKNILIKIGASGRSRTDKQNHHILSVAALPICVPGQLVEPLGIEPQSFGFSVQRAHLLRQSSIRPHLGIEPSFFQKFGPGAPKEGNTYIRFEPTVRFELTCPIGSWLQIRCNQPLCEVGIDERLLTDLTGTFRERRCFNLPIITNVSYVLSPTIRGNTH